MQISVDKSTINAIMNPLDTYHDTVDGLIQIADRGRKIEEQTHIVEKSGNLIVNDHFTTDDKVQYCLNMDDYENKKANGESVDALDTLVYLKSKSAAGYELDRSDMSDLRLSSGIVLDGATDAIRENLEANIRVNSREDILASLAVLDKYDSGDAKDARSYLSGIRAAGEERQYISDEISKVDISLSNNEKEISKVQKLIKENAVLCIQVESKTENQYYVLTKNDGIQMNGKGADGKAVYTVNTDTIEYVKEEKLLLSSKIETSTSDKSVQTVAKVDYSSSDGGNSVYVGANPKGAVFGLNRTSADLTSNGSSAYTETSLTVTGKGAAAGVVVAGATVLTTVVIKNPGVAAEFATQLIPTVVPVMIQTAK
ncbi:MAG: hypothetical protein CVV49_18355 [Spirochaetae bacterium HGW-Spirochaetae-5]|nr:MAG: hypothetical protein CVV49_18355 [Spirochaetae bacterium HGW-Spirochaetae-5]